MRTGFQGEGEWAFEQYELGYPRPRKKRRAHLLDENDEPRCGLEPMSSKYRLVTRGSYDAESGTVVVGTDELPTRYDDSRRACSYCVEIAEFMAKRVWVD